MHACLGVERYRVSNSDLHSPLASQPIDASCGARVYIAVDVIAGWLEPVGLAAAGKRGLRPPMYACCSKCGERGGSLAPVRLAVGLHVPEDFFGGRASNDGLERIDT